MQKRYLPPTRRSILQAGAVKRSGPHQRLRCSQFVHAFHTSSRGASKTRVMTISRSWVSVSGIFCALLAAIASFSFFLQLVRAVAHVALKNSGLRQVLCQAIELAIPSHAVAIARLR